MRLGLNLSLGGGRGQGGGNPFDPSGATGMNFNDVEMTFGDADMTGDF
jgi:hypothetical protein